MTLDADSVIVRHYDETRPVAYDCKQFISKNKNKLPDGMVMPVQAANVDK